MTEPGELLNGRYRVREVLTGGMGQILICELAGAAAELADPSVRVALKTFQRRYFFDSAARASFIREASTWLRLSDLPHVMPVMGIETIGDQPHIMMPAVPPGPSGERSIADLLDRGPLDPEIALAYAFQVAFALHGASGRIPGLVHGDLKPANVLLLGGRAFVSDFGLVSSMALGRPDLRLEGTWRYRAPELWANPAAPTSVAGDVYAFGALLFEMLAGQAPVSATGDRREDWAAAHRELSPQIPDDFPAAALPTAAMALALSCLAKDPGERPSDFTEVFGQIVTIYAKFDQDGFMQVATQTYELHTTLFERTPFLRGERVRSLLALQEATQALEELDAIPPEEYDANLWVVRGSALISLDRPEEALDALKRGLEGELSPQEFYNAVNEGALALKRLGRFADAREHLEMLLERVDDEQLPGVLVNLATIYVEAGQGDEVVRLLEPFVRRTPGLSLAWANLGEGYALLGRYKDAAAAFVRALVLTPQDGLTRVRLAVMYMDHLGRPDLAWAALDEAFDSGHQSPEWFVRMLAASLLLDRRDTVQVLLGVAKHNHSEDVAEQLVAESFGLARKLADRYGGTPDEPHVSAGTSEAAARSIDADAAPTPVPPADVQAPGAGTTPGAPFLNIRHYGFFDFTIDYYQWPDTPGYVAGLLERLRPVLRDPRLASYSGSGMRGSPFSFTICPGCGITVLTNRDVGKAIRCRMCNTTFPTAPVSRPDFDRIVAEVSAELGIQALEDPQAPDVHVLFVQPPDTAADAAAGEVCRAAGMAELGKNHLITMHMLREATSRGIARPDRPWSVWTLPRSEPDAWARDSTPKALSPVIRELQFRAPGVMTLTTTMSAQDIASMDKTLEETAAAAERTLRDTIRSGEAQARELRELAWLLDRRGEHREAERKARAAVAADDTSAEGWEILGRTLLQQEDFAAARDAIEAALARDPTSVAALMMLARCYERLGDDELARELYTRATSRTGGELA
jgi:tetratricopeptide (TPR) repeat protein